MSNASTRFKFVLDTNGAYVNTYHGTKIKTGEEIEYSGDLAFKATLNPDYEIVKAKPQVKKAPLKKPSGSDPAPSGSM